jgi:ATP-dependent Clp protease, protease subunit
MRTFKTIAVAMVLALCAIPSFAFTDAEEGILERLLKSKCPKTQVVGDLSDCLVCHVKGSFAVKESAPDAASQYPVTNMRVLDGTAYLLVNEAIRGTEGIAEFNVYLQWHPEIDHVIIDIYSPGGNLFTAYQLRGFMNTWKTTGITVETRVHGFAASAATVIFVSGSKGHRFIDPNAEFMLHELTKTDMSFLRQTTPTNSEEEARILRHLQDELNSYLASTSKMTTDEIDAKVRNKEFWMSGREALKHGFADAFLGRLVLGPESVDPGE